MLFDFFVGRDHRSAMSSLVARESLLRKLSFPRLVIPTSVDADRGDHVLRQPASSSSCSSRGTGSSRSSNWLLIVPLLLELYIFILGVALILSTLFVRLRDIGQVWELALAAALLRVADHLPGRLPAALVRSTIAFLNPFTQVARRTSARSSSTRTSRITDHGRRTSSDAVGAADPDRDRARHLRRRRSALFQREEPWFAERV